MKAATNLGFFFFLAFSVHPLFAEPATDRPLLDCYISTGDNHWLGQSLPIDSKASIEASFDLLKRLGVRRVYWRGLEAATWVDSHQERPESCRYYSFWKWLRYLYKEVDPDRLAVAAARRRGMEIWGVASLVDWGSQADVPPFKTYPFNSESRLRIEHPEWVPVDKFGVLRQGGPIEFAYPEARRALVRLLMKFMRRDRYDGMVFLTYAENHSMRFQDEFGFNQPVVEEFKKRYGIDIRIQTWQRFATRFDWYKLRGEYLTQFLRELKSELKKDNQKLGFFVQPWKPHWPQPWNVPELMLTAGMFYLDLETWIRDGVVDNFLVYGNSDPQMQVRAVRNMQWMTRQTPCKVGILTSGPKNAWWLPFQKQGVPTVLAWGEDDMYLDRSYLPEQTAAALSAENPLRVMRALSQVIHSQLKARFEEVAPLLKHHHLIVRRLALHALGKLADPRGAPLIEKALFDPENSIRCMAALALRDCYRDESLDQVLKAVEMYDNHPLEEILRVTIPHLRPNPKDRLAEVFRSSRSDGVRRIAMRSLQFLPDVSLLPVWKAGLSDPDRFTRFAAAAGLGKLRNSPDAARILLAALEHEDCVVANQAASALGEFCQQNAGPIRPLRPRILDGLKRLYARFGHGCSRADAKWGYRPVGNALLDCGKEGEAVLRSFLRQDKDIRLAEMAWKSLYIRQQPGSFSEVTEKENETAFRARPLSLKTMKVIRLQQDFDDVNWWKPDSRGSVGNVRTRYGRWGGLLTPGPVIGTGEAKSGTQSLKLVRGGHSFSGQALPGIADGNDYEFAFSVYPANEQSSFITVLNGYSGKYIEEVALFLAPGGGLSLRDMKTSKWIDTGLKISPGRWSRVRLASRRNFGTYRVTVQKGEEEEEVSILSAPLRQVPGLRLVQFIPQPPEGSVVYLDDVQWNEIR